MEKKYSYKITPNGYYILINGEKVIVQEEPYIPNPKLSYEENAKAQIAELEEAEKNATKEQATIESLQEQITDLQLAMVELFEMGV